MHFLVDGRSIGFRCLPCRGMTLRSPQLHQPARTVSPPYPPPLFPRYSELTMVNAELHEVVSSALERNPYLQHRNLRFETHQEGRVVLRGVVRSYYQKQMAQEMLRGLAGIQAIENHLEVSWAM